MGYWGAMRTVAMTVRSVSPGWSCTVRYTAPTGVSVESIMGEVRPTWNNWIGSVRTNLVEWILDVECASYVCQANSLCWCQYLRKVLLILLACISRSGEVLCPWLNYCVVCDRSISHNTTTKLQTRMSWSSSPLTISEIISLSKRVKSENILETLESSNMFECAKFELESPWYSRRCSFGIDTRK